MSDWMTEGTAHRSPVQMNPVIHLLVREGPEWSMWCSAGKGRPDHVPHASRFCPRCRKLARDAYDEGMLDEQDARRFLPDQAPRP